MRATLLRRLFGHVLGLSLGPLALDGGPDRLVEGGGGRRRLLHGGSGLGSAGGLDPQAAIDGADLQHPPAPVGVLQVQDVARWPVKVVGDEGYLLVELVEGVA
jgi:hypothetical protein